MPAAKRYTGIIDTYRDRLPLADDVPVIGLGEGNTPLVRLGNVPRALGRDVDIYVKFEGLNPTASFKDRGMTVAVSQAVSEGARAIICASTGNTSASAAAYAARAGITAFVLIPEGKIALGKLAQAMIYGAKVIQIRGNFDAGMRLVRELAEAAPVTIVNSINPYRIQGQKTAAFEIVDALGAAPDFHCLPVGNAGNITAYWLGYREYFDAGMCNTLPVMVGYQAAGAAPFVHGEMVAEPDTIATAIRIGSPQSWDSAWAARNESGGWFASRSDEEILQAQRMLADHEGIFCEPASAASLAGLIPDIESGRIPEGSRVVCTLTGHGLKDPDIAIRHSVEPFTVDATMEAVKAVILDNMAETQARERTFRAGPIRDRAR